MNIFLKNKSGEKKQFKDGLKLKAIRTRSVLNSRTILFYKYQNKQTKQLSIYRITPLKYEKQICILEEQ